MNNPRPPPGAPRSASLGQRLLALALLGVFAYLVWLAPSGRFDREVNRVAHWLQQGFAALTR